MVLLLSSLSASFPRPHTGCSHQPCENSQRGPSGGPPNNSPGVTSLCPFSSSRSNYWHKRRGPHSETEGEKQEGQFGWESEEALNMSNMMPNIPNTKETGLSTDRKISSIPKTGEAKTWVYPSTAQFFRALQRKGKSAEKEAMLSVLYVHNFVNEATWEKIKELEKNHPECQEPTLTSFCGRSDDLTLTARLMKRLDAWGELFDRHDWFVDRCGRQVRYIIDYYDDPNANNVAEVYIHARPAPFDSFVNFRDAARQIFQSLWRGERP